MNEIVYESPEQKELAAALSAAQGEFPCLEKDKTIVKTYNGKQVTNSYSSLENAIKTVTPALSKHNLAIIQRQRVVDDKIFMITRLMHSSGQWIDSWTYLAPVGLESDDQQNFGTAKSYQRRYELLAMLNIAASDETDNDGNTPDIQPEPKKKPIIIPPKKISPEQVNEILTIVQRHDGLKEAVCKALKIKALTELSVSDYKLALETAEKMASYLK